MFMQTAHMRAHTKSRIMPLQPRSNLVSAHKGMAGHRLAKQQLSLLDSAIS